MTETSALVETLVADAAPVRRLLPPTVRAGCWLIVALVVISALTFVFGVRPDFGERLRQPIFLLGSVATLMTGVLAAFAAFVASLPDRSRLWLALPFPAALLWFTAVGIGCLTKWVAFVPNGIQLVLACNCVATLLATSLPLSAVMFWMLRHVAMFRTTGVTCVASLSIAALTASAITLLHEFNASVMILVWNLGTVALVVAMDAIIARKLLR
jgi:hypothetical protein